MDLTARTRAISFMLALLPAAAAIGQFTDDIPRASYFAAKEVLYYGEYRDAERNLRRERGVRTTQSNWIDAICYHAMIGETLFHQGRNAEALAEFDEACQVFLAYPDWLLQVKFQQPPRADANRARRIAPWGRSTRSAVPGLFPNTDQVLVGDLNAAQRYRTGGVVSAPMFWRVNVIEIVRATALAIRRRNQLLGPLAPQDSISKELSVVLNRSNLAPPNHWSNAWIDVLRSFAQSGMGKIDEAEMLLGRSLVVEGQFDHPLTAAALMEQGRIAMLKGDGRKAAQLLAEAGFSAFYFEDWDILTESTLLGWLNHLGTNASGVYTPLDAVAAWAQVNRLQHVSTKLRLAQGESLLWLGQLSAAGAVLEDAGRRVGEMRGGLPGIHLLYLQAAFQLLQGKTDAGANILTRALAAQSAASLRNFQILRTNQMYDARAASPRLAIDFYKALLSDPTPADWIRDPLDAMAVLTTGQDAAFDRWFLAALERKEPALALEIADRSKRRRYLASQPLGGRLIALRAILESPVADLSQEAILQRQRILGSFPEYQSSLDAAVKIREQLLATPIIAATPAETKTISALFDALNRSAIERQHMLAQIAVRRLPTACEFPPSCTAAELQQSLGKDEALVEFHNAAGNMYGFLVTSAEIRIWQLPEARELRAGLAELLKSIGNYSASRQLSIAELTGDAWRDASKQAFETIFGGIKLDVSKMTGLVIVPDDVLWYLPFEVLTPTIANAANADKVLADMCPIRYGPIAALTVPHSRPLRRTQHTGILANDLSFATDDADRDAILLELKAAFPGPLVLEESLSEPPNLVASVIDQLIAMDDIESNARLGEAASLLPRARAQKESLNDWIVLPFGGPEQIVLTGVATQAEQGLKVPKRAGARASAAASAATGSEVFQSLCNLMAGGARTILMTRWRTGGRTNFDLVREFAKELPSAPAAEAWQRACLLAREAPVDATREPRLKRANDSGELPTPDHPFFWAGYILVDNAPRANAPTPPDPPKPAQPTPADAAKDTPQGPPPAKPAEAADKSPTPETTKGKP